MKNLLVRANNVSKTYGEGERRVTAVDNVTFEVQDESHVALVGPSGSGKTTLLHLIAGLDIPSTGTIEWPALGTRKQLKPGSVTMAFQGPSLLPALTVVENVALPSLLAGVDEQQSFDKAWAMLERMSLTQIASKLPEELSGGQSQRVGIARALVTKPALLLTDEPTGQQDHENAQKLMNFLLSYAKEIGGCLILATHDMAVAGRFSTLWFMENGRLQTEEQHVQSRMD
ncbi:MAG TPA: ABC transporter ATP-binding protein [Candidatus Aquicultor sp.]